MLLKYLRSGIVCGFFFGIGFLLFEDIIGLIVLRVEFTLKQVLYSIPLYSALFIIAGLGAAVLSYISAGKRKRENNNLISTILLLLTCFAIFYLGYRDVVFRFVPLQFKIQLVAAFAWGMIILLIYATMMKLIRKGAEGKPKIVNLRGLALCIGLTAFTLINLKIDSSPIASASLSKWEPWWRLIGLSFSLGISLLIIYFGRQFFKTFSVNAGSRSRYGYLYWGLALIVIALIPIVFGSSNRHIANYPIQKSHAGGNLPNILLIILDTLRADHLNLYGYDRPTSEWISEYAAKGVVFLNAMSPSSWTKPSVASILTSSYPGINGVDDWIDIMPSELTTIAEVLEDCGYYSAGISSNPFVSNEYNYAQGFDEFTYLPGHGFKQLFFPNDILCSRLPISYEYALQMELMDGDISYGNAHCMNREIIPWLHNNKDRCFFLYLHYMDPHQPYYPSEKHYSGGQILTMGDYRHLRHLHNPQDTLEVDSKILNTMVNRYDDEIINLDRKLKEVFQTLSGLNLLEKTLVIITSDHGDEFCEHGFGGHGHSMFQELIHIPFIMIFPGGEFGGKSIERRVDLLDLAPTIFDYLGIEPDVRMDGVSLMPLLRNEEQKYAESKPVYFGEVNPVEDEWPLQTVYALVSGKFKFIRSVFKDSFKSDRLALYDLAADPFEQLNLIGVHRELSDSLALEMENYRDYCNSLRIQVEDLELKNLSDQQREKLRSLGYIK